MSEVLDNLHNPVAELIRQVALPPIANQVRGLPVSGDEIAIYWRPIARARAAAPPTEEQT